MGQWDWVIGTPRERIAEAGFFQNELEARVREALMTSVPTSGDPATMLPPQYLLGAYPSQMQDIVVDGAEGPATVGFEGLAGEHDKPGYRGVIPLDVPLPLLSVTPRRLRALSALAERAAPEAATARALSGVAEIDARFSFFTRAPRLPRALLMHEPFATALAGAAVFLPRVGIDPSPAGSSGQGAELTVELPDAENTNVIAAGMALLRAFRAAALACADMPDVLSVADTRAGLAADADIEGLLGAVVNATSWLGGPVARVGDGVEARLVLDTGVSDATAGRQASLSAQLAGGKVRLRLRAELGDDAEPFTLTPQTGWRATLARIGELEVGDAALDDAYVIRAAASARSILSTRRLELLRLAEHGASITSAGGALELEAEVSTDPVDVADAASAALALWRGLVIGHPLQPHH